MFADNLSSSFISYLSSCTCAVVACALCSPSLQLAIICTNIPGTAINNFIMFFQLIILRMSHNIHTHILYWSKALRGLRGFERLYNYHNL